MRNFLYSIPTARARGDLAVIDHRLAFFKPDTVPGPINFVADPVRNIRGSRQDQTHDAGVVIVKSRIVRPDDWIMFRRPLQLAAISHSAGYDRVGIDGAILHLAQRFLLGAQKNIAADLGRRAVRPH